MRTVNSRLQHQEPGRSQEKAQQRRQVAAGVACQRAQPAQRIPLLHGTFALRVGEPQLDEPQLQQDGIA